jgi:protocatechuate 3,4-dioxygenase beta subunit
VRRVWLLGLAVAAALVGLWLWLRSGGHAPAHVDHAEAGARAAQRAGEPAQPAPVPGWFGPRGVGPRRIAGHVTFEGKPVAGARVALRDVLTEAGIQPEETRRSTADGSFDFGVRPAGNYRVAASAPGRTGVFAHVRLGDPTATPPPDRLDLRLHACVASIAGTVVDADGDPIAGAQVRVASIYGVDTDAHGRYRLCARPGELPVGYGADGYGRVLLTVDVRGKTRQDVVLVPEATLAVQAISAEDGRALGAVRIDVWPTRWGPARAEGHSAVTGPDGWAQVAGLVPGGYRVSGVGDGTMSVEPTHVDVIAGPNPPVTLRLATAARVRGTLLRGTSPVGGARVQALSPAGAPRSFTAYSQADGSFDLDLDSTGDVSFTASPYRVVSPAKVHVGPAGAAGVVVQVEPLGAIHGHVTRNGAAVADARVGWAIDARGMRLQARTDDDGHYHFDGVPAGTYKLTTSTDEAFNLPVEVVLADGEDRTVDLELDQAGTIAGTVVDQDGAPVPGVFVRWTHETTGDLGHCATDDAGRYRCGAMTGGGRYRAAVFPDATTQGAFPTADGSPYPAVEVQGPTSEVDGVRLAIRYQHLTIRGRVVDGSGSPVADARVRALSIAPGTPPVFNPWAPLPMTFTDGDGGFRLGGLAVGHYALRAQASDGGDGILPDVEAGATDAVISLRRPGGIAGTLVGFSGAPTVLTRPVGTHSGDSQVTWCPVEGTAFHARGLPPGRYIVSARAPDGGDAALVDVRTGETAKVTLTARGKGAIDGSVRDFRTGKPVADARCLAFPAAGDELGPGAWNLATAATSDATGALTIDPAAAGSGVVVCIMPSPWTQASARVDVPPGGRAAATVLSVERRLDTSGTLGLTFDWEVDLPRVATVVPGSPAAAAGLAPGDFVVAVDGAPVANLNGPGVWTLIDDRPVGTAVAVTVQRGAARTTFTAKTAAPPP